MTQSSDHMQSKGDSGTKVESLTPKPYERGVTDSIAPSGVLPSGSSQSDHRGKQGMGGSSHE